MKKVGLAGLISPAVRLSSTSQGYMTPFRDTRYHKTHFRGVDVRTLDRQEKFNYIHSKLRNWASERAVAYPGTGSILQEGKASMGYHILLCIE